MTATTHTTTTRAIGRTGETLRSPACRRRRAPSVDAYFSVRLPCLTVGTVGGGTALPTQRECLDLLGCYGTGRADKFAEIVAATLLAGEISLCAGLAGNTFIGAHARKREFRPWED